MIHEKPYVEKLKTEYGDRLEACLGKLLISAKRRFYKQEGCDEFPPDTREIVLTFDSRTLYFDWEQYDDEFDLAIHDETHLTDGQFSERKAEDDGILSKVLGKKLTEIELYEDEFGSLLAALLSFEDQSLVIAVGHSDSNPHDPNDQEEEFRHFHGDDFYLWTVDEFKAALQKQPLEIARHQASSNV